MLNTFEAVSLTASCYSRRGNEMKKLLTVLLMLMISVCLFAGGSSEAKSEEEKGGSYLMGTGSATGNYYNFGSVLAQVVNTHTNTNLTVTSTGGSVENARLLGSAENEFAMIQTDVTKLCLYRN